MPSTAGRQTRLIRRRPVITWVLMSLSLVSALFLLDWSDVGVPRPFWFFVLASVFGLAGMGFALRAQRIGWALASAVWGVAMVPTLLVVVTMLYGP